jgi:hypothetical protein
MRWLVAVGAAPARYASCGSAPPTPTPTSYSAPITERTKAWAWTRAAVGVDAGGVLTGQLGEMRHARRA